MNGLEETRRASFLRRRRPYLWGGLVVALVVGAAALGRASVPHTFNTGDTLTANDLNTTFAGLDSRLTTLEAKDPFAGTAPAVVGLGSTAFSCGPAPATLNLSAAPVASGSLAYSDAFGHLLFTNAGSFTINMSFGATSAECAAGTTVICASPVTFFLKSPVDQSITIHAYVDNAGALYVNGTQTATGAGVLALSYTAMANMPFSISVMSCSNDGPSMALAIYDQFITKYGLQVDYDATFHRNGK
jgi:hypothetical protein